MVDRLRLLADRPIQDGDRARVFTVVVALIVGAAALLALLDDPEPAPSRTTPAASASKTVAENTPDPQPAVTAPAAPDAPSEESDLPEAQRPRDDDITHSKRAARRFLRQFLAFSYGRAPASTITAATAELRADMANNRPRVPDDEKRRRARVELVQTNGVGRERADLSALVTDGERRYTLRLQLANTAAGWLVAAVER